MIQPPDLPRLDPGAQAMVNLLNRDRATYELSLYADLMENAEQHSVFLTFEPCVSNRAVFQSARLRSDIADITIFATQVWLEQLCDIALAGWREESNEALSWDVCAAYVLSRLAKLSLPTLGPLAVTDVQTETELPNDPSLCLIEATIETGEQVHPIAVWIQHCDFNGIGNLQNPPDPSMLVDPGFAFSVSCMPQTVAVREVDRLRAGSIITFGHVLDGRCDVTCRIPGVGSFAATLGPEGALEIGEVNFGAIGMSKDIDQAKEDFAPTIPDADAQDTAGSTELPDPVMQAINHVTDLGALPVRIEFCFASQTMSLNALSGLQTGSSLEVKCRLEDRLTVRVNGQVVGSGYLVDIDGVLGLKISDWALKPASQAVDAQADPV